MTANQHTARVGFIGLGDQGAPMGQAIGDSGFGLHVWARRPQSLEVLARTRHTVHDSPADLAAAPNTRPPAAWMVSGRASAVASPRRLRRAWPSRCLPFRCWSGARRPQPASPAARTGGRCRGSGGAGELAALDREVLGDPQRPGQRITTG